MKFLLFVVATLSTLSIIDAQIKKTDEQKTCEGIEDGAYIADPVNCRRFYRCEKGKPIFGSCSGTELYSVVHNACVVAKDAVCVGDYANIVCRGEPEGKMVQDPEDCKKYFTCSKGKPTSETSVACSNRQSFNANEGKCVTPSTYVCPPAKQCKLVSTGFFISHSNANMCGGYYYCHNSIAISGQCRDNFKFNPLEGVCDWNYQCNQVGCQPNQKVATPNTCAKYHDCKSIEVNAASTCPYKKHFDPNLSRNRDPCGDPWNVRNPCLFDRCENMPDGFYVAVPGTDCKEFHYCLKGKRSSETTIQCQGNGYLNEEYQRCSDTKPNLAICN